MHTRHPSKNAMCKDEPELYTCIKNTLPFTAAEKVSYKIKSVKSNHVCTEQALQEVVAAREYTEDIRRGERCVHKETWRWRREKERSDSRDLDGEIVSRQ